jgi:hypothetical protein
MFHYTSIKMFCKMEIMYDVDSNGGVMNGCVHELKHIIAGVTDEVIYSNDD